MPIPLFKCCVCGAMSDGNPAELWSGCYACSRHSWSEVLASHVVFTRLREVEREYYREIRRDPKLLVWSSHAILDVRQSVRTVGVLRMPDGIRVLVIPDDSVPQMFACDEVLASALLTTYGVKARARKRPEEDDQHG